MIMAVDNYIRKDGAMNKKELRKFLELVSKNSASGDFEIYCGMNRREVEELKTELGINDNEDAKRLLLELEQDSSVALAQIIEKNKLEQRKFNDDKQKRYDDLQAKNQRLRDQQSKKAKKVTAKKALQVKKQQENRLEKLNSLAIIKDSKWTLPPDSSADEFIRLLKGRGLGFVRDKYGISNRDILATIQKLKLKIDVDLLPR